MLAVVLTCVICQQCWYFRNKLIMNNVPRPQQSLMHVHRQAMKLINTLDQCAARLPPRPSRN